MLLARLKKRLPHPLIWASYALLVLTFEPFNLGFCAFIALIPFLEALRQQSTWKGAFKQGLWLCWLFSVTTFFWVAYVITEFGQTHWTVGGLALILFGFIGQPQFYLTAPLISWALRRFGRHPNSAGQAFLGVLFVALFYSGFDWLFPKLFVDTLGHASIHMDRLKQIADIGGPPLLTFVFLVTNLSLLDLWHRLRNRGEPALGGAIATALPGLLLSVALVAGSLVYGTQRIALVADRLTQPARTLQTAVIQANIGDLDKLASERGFRGAAARVMQTFYDMTEEALKHEPRPEIVLWPETSYPSAFRVPENAEDYARDQRLENFVRDKQFTLLFGGYDQNRFGTSYNALFYLKPDGSLLTYYKTILLMFGEYIPGADWIPGLKSAFPMVAYFGKGPGSVIRELHGVKTQPIICYEVLFPNFIRRAVTQGAQLIVNVTNDSWFGPYGAPYHHLNLSSFRSIETRTPQIRSTNTGISALILPDGRITGQTKLFQPEILHTSIPIIEPIPTLMLKWGDWFGGFALGVSFLFALGTLIRERRRR